MLEEAKVAIERSQLFQQPRAEIISQHMAGLALCELGRYDEALWYLQNARQLTAALGAWRFEAENQSFIADVYLCMGERDRAREAASEAVAYARKTGMAYFGASALAALARTEDDPETRRELIAEVEEILADRAVSHNHWIARRWLIELGWDLKAPNLIEDQTSRLAVYAALEPTPFTEIIVARGHLLRKRLGKDWDSTAEDVARVSAVVRETGAVRIGAELS